jgi:hypothetical protein
MTLGLNDAQLDLRDDLSWFCESTLSEQSIFSVLARERDRLFADSMFSDLFSSRGRRSVPPSVVAVVMVLQRLEGLSDREAVSRFAFDARWRYAAGVGGYDVSCWTTFAHTVLVDMRARLASSEHPRRIFDAVLRVARQAGVVGAKRVLDSTPLYDAVATMDTITLIRSAMRSLLRVADGELASQLRGVLSSGDPYESSGKPQIDWEDAQAREGLIDSRARDAMACLELLETRELPAAVSEAASLLAVVVGQDLETGEDGSFRIARRVAKGRVISTVDPEARHGHKSSARGFDGYKGHAAVDPDSEIITQSAVTPGNAADASAAGELLREVLESPGTEAQSPSPTEPGDADPEPDAPVVYGDTAYGTGELLSRLEQAGVESRCKAGMPSAPAGLFSKSDFEVDLEAQSVTCPQGHTVPLVHGKDPTGALARFGAFCTGCPLASKCTRSAHGRTIRVGPHEAVLQRARAEQQSPAWADDYRATRPKVERKLAHLTRRLHGGRRARMRGRLKIDADFNLLAAAQNLLRLAVLGIRWNDRAWTVAGA